jgi:hypothetical protein
MSADSSGWTEISLNEEVMLAPGGPAELLNLSETAALVETSARLSVDAEVAVCIGGPRPRRLPGRVVRSQVCGIRRDNSMSYEVAISFEPAPRSEKTKTAAAPVATEAFTDVDGGAHEDGELSNEW